MCSSVLTLRFWTGLERSSSLAPPPVNRVWGTKWPAAVTLNDIYGNLSTLEPLGLFQMSWIEGLGLVPTNHSRRQWKAGKAGDEAKFVLYSGSWTPFRTGYETRMYKPRSQAFFVCCKQQKRGGGGGGGEKRDYKNSTFYGIVLSFPNVQGCPYRVALL